MKRTVKKICFTTVLSDSYIQGALVTIYSILQSTPNFNYDFIILDWGELSAVNKAMLKKIYNKITFKTVDKDLYTNCKYDSTYRKWKYNCNYRFDIFTLDMYDTVVFIDCDFLVLQNFNPLLNKNIDFGAVLSKKEYIPQLTNEKCFSAGLLIVGKRFLNNKVRNQLIKLSMKEPPKSNLNINLWMSDEPILNNFFIDHLTPIHCKYNTLLYKYELDTLDKKHNIHFNGTQKPWNSREFLHYFNEFSTTLEKYGIAKGSVSILKLFSFYEKMRLDAEKIATL
jgi:lipopolysaccharide biosynthesis glycosyltransferase